MQCILVKSDEFENSYPLLYILFKSCLCFCLLATLAPQQQLFASGSVNINLILIEREGRTGKYWTMLAVWTECSEVRTNTTEGQYSPKRLKLARLVSRLLYGTRAMLVCFLLKRTSGHLNSKGFRRNMFLVTWTTQKGQVTTSLIRKQIYNINHVEYKQDFKNAF